MKLHTIKLTKRKTGFKTVTKTIKWWTRLMNKKVFGEADVVDINKEKRCRISRWESNKTTI